MSPLFLKKLVLPFVVSCTLLLSACGGDDDNDNTASTEEETAVVEVTLTAAEIATAQAKLDAESDVVAQMASTACNTSSATALTAAEVICKQNALDAIDRPTSI